MNEFVRTVMSIVLTLELDCCWTSRQTAAGLIASYTTTKWQMTRKSPIISRPSQLYSGHLANQVSRDLSSKRAKGARQPTLPRPQG